MNRLTPSRLDAPCPSGPVETFEWDTAPGRLCLFGGECVVVLPGDIITGQTYDFNGRESMMFYSVNRPKTN